MSVDLIRTPQSHPPPPQQLRSSSTTMEHLGRMERNQRALYNSLLKNLSKDISKAYHALNARLRARLESCTDPLSTVFMLDWDDTCCATSWLSSRSCDPQQFWPGDDDWLLLLEHCVLKILKRAVKLGRVVIVTNAGEGWVQLSCSRWLPSVGEFLREHKSVIKIVSARSRYEVICGSEVAWQWKRNTFYDELMEIDRVTPKVKVRNIVVLGDSVADQYAAHAACAKLKCSGVESRLKVVKFLDQPCIEQLCKQVNVLTEQLEAMVVYPTGFDVAMCKKPTKAKAPQDIDKQSEALTP